MNFVVVFNFSKPWKRFDGSQDPWSSIVRLDKGADSFDASDHEQFMESFSSTSCSKLDDDRVWSSQEWKTETPTCDRVERLDDTFWRMARKVQPGHEEILHDGIAQSVRNEEVLHDRSGRPDDINCQEVEKPENFVMGNDGTELELSVEFRSFVNRVNDQVRKRQKRISSFTANGEEHFMIWGMFMAVTMESATFMGKNYQNNRNSVVNAEDLTLKRMFDIYAKLGGILVGEASQPGPPDLAIREFDMTAVDSSADEPTQQQHGWSDGSSTDIVREQEPRRRLVLMSGNTHVETRAGSGRRVVLIPASPGSTPQSVQDLQPSVGSNRFAVLADDDEDIGIVTEDPPAPDSMASGERIARPSRARPIQRSIRRRLVLRGVTERTDAVQVPPGPHVIHSAMAGPDDPPSDADSDDDRVAFSEGGENEALEELPEPADPIPFDLLRRNLRAGFTVLHGVSLPEVFARRAVVMRSIPKCFRGACVAAVRMSIHEILDGKASGNIQREVCGWKLFFLLPRLLLFRPLRGGLVSKTEVA